MFGRGGLPFDVETDHLLAIGAHDMAAFWALVFFGNVLLDAGPDSFDTVGFCIDSIWVATVPSYHFLSGFLS